MRTKTKRYNKDVASATFGLGVEALGVSGQFEGGFVLVVGHIEFNTAVGQWSAAYLTLDGVNVSPGMGGWQSGGNFAIDLLKTVRISHGVHHLGILFNAGVAPVAASCTGFIDVVELNA